jgi:hypothetical protein
VRTTRYRSRTQPGVSYKTDTHDGEGICDCPGFRSWGHCFHVDLEKEQGMTDNEKAVAIRDEGDEPPAPMALTIPERTLPTSGELAVMGQIAKTLASVRGHSVPKEIDSPAKAAAVILAGWEVGLKPMTAFRRIFVVNGRTELDAQALMGVVKAKDQSAEFIFHEYTATGCTVELRRGDKTVVTASYTLEDATKSGQVAKGGPWKQYPRDMCAWAAVKRACRLGAPDLINAIPAVDVGAAGDMLGAVDDAPLGIEEPELPEEAVNELCEIHPAQGLDINGECAVCAAALDEEEAYAAEEAAREQEALL